MNSYWHHILFWLMVVVIGYLYFRHGLPGFRKMGVNHTLPPAGEGKNDKK